MCRKTGRRRTPYVGVGCVGVFSSRPVLRDHSQNYLTSPPTTTLLPTVLSVLLMPKHLSRLCSKTDLVAFPFLFGSCLTLLRPLCLTPLGPLGSLPLNSYRILGPLHHSPSKIDGFTHHVPSCPLSLSVL